MHLGRLSSVEGVKEYEYDDCYLSEMDQHMNYPNVHFEAKTDVL